MANVKSNMVINTYIKDEIENLLTIFPKATEEQVSSFIMERVEKFAKAPVCKIDNNYKHSVKLSSLDKVVNFIEKKNPILTEHGVMYKNQHEAKNLNAGLLDFLIAQRKVEKNLMFKCIEAADKETDPEKKDALLKQAAVHDTKQKIYKIVANS